MDVETPLVSPVQLPVQPKRLASFGNSSFRTPTTKPLATTPLATTPLATTPLATTPLATNPISNVTDSNATAHPPIPTGPGIVSSLSCFFSLVVDWNQTCAHCWRSMPADALYRHELTCHQSPLPTCSYCAFRASTLKGETNSVPKMRLLFLQMRDLVLTASSSMFFFSLCCSFSLCRCDSDYFQCSDY
jgi:hypothetical protein